MGSTGETNPSLQHMVYLSNCSKTERTISKANMQSLIDAADINSLKRPDKVLPCPRCNSLDTKFCYYNNYNINQPRHFCKGCQRYWTAGGSLRNVAIGAGRRKRKHASLESELATMDDSAVEHCTARNSSQIKLSSKLRCGSVKDEFACRVPESVKPIVLPFDPSTFVASSNPLSLHVQESESYEYMHSKRIAASHGKVGPFCDPHDGTREQASTFHDFMHAKHIAAPHDNVGAPCNLHEQAYDRVHVEQTRTGSSGLHVDSQSNECVDLGVSTTSSARQASNESGCASSLTTLTMSVDACATDGKSDAMDSEVAKEGDEVDKGGSLVNGTLGSVHILPHIAGGTSAMSSYAHCEVSRAATHAQRPLAQKVALENPAPGAVWPMLSSTLTWGPPSDPADRSLFWGFPWGPAANAVNAAKAALIPHAGLSQKHQTELNVPSEKRLWVPKTLRIKDTDEAARSSIWSTLGIRDGQGSVLSEKAKEAFQCHAKEVDAPADQSQHANPVALTQSMAFRESS
eukprot:c9421_g1_i1 orf=85-1635(+)